VKLRMEQEVRKMKRQENHEKKVVAYEDRLKTLASEKAEQDKEKLELVKTKVEAREEAQRKLVATDLESRKAMAKKLTDTDKSYEERRRILVAEKKAAAAKHQVMCADAWNRKKTRDRDEEDERYESFMERQAELNERRKEVITPRIAVHTPRQRAASNAAAAGVWYSSTGSWQTHQYKEVAEVAEQREANWNRYVETLTAKSASARDRNETHETRKEENMRRKREREAERLAEESQLSEQKQQRSRTASPRGRDAANRPQDILLGRLVEKNKKRVERRDEQRRYQHLAKIFMADERYANEKHARRLAEVELGAATQRQLMTRDQVNAIMWQIPHMTTAQLKAVTLPGGVTIELDEEPETKEDAKDDQKVQRQKTGI